MSDESALTQQLQGPHVNVREGLAIIIEGFREILPTMFTSESWGAFIRLCVRAGITEEEFVSELQIMRSTFRGWCDGTMQPHNLFVPQVIEFIQKKILTPEPT